jgi:hypothetical protein
MSDDRELGLVVERRIVQTRPGRFHLKALRGVRVVDAKSGETVGRLNMVTDTSIEDFPGGQPSRLTVTSIGFDEELVE